MFVYALPLLHYGIAAKWLAPIIDNAARDGRQPFGFVVLFKNKIEELYIHDDRLFYSDCIECLRFISGILELVAEEFERVIRNAMGLNYSKFLLDCSCV
jgi:hypothetical protein